MSVDTLLEEIILEGQKRGLNATQLGVKAGFDKSTISLWKNGKRKPSIENLLKLLLALDYTLAIVDKSTGHIVDTLSISK